MERKQIAKAVFEMKDHGGRWGANNPGEFRFRVAEAYLADGVRFPIVEGQIVSDYFVKVQHHGGVDVEIVQLESYPAPPGLRRLVRK